MANYQNLDDTVDLNQDVYVKDPRQNAGNWQQLAEQQARRDRGFTDQERGNAISKIQNYIVRQYTPATIQEITTYVQNNRPSLPDGIYGVLEKVLLGDGNPDMKACLMKGFVTYMTPKDKKVLVIALSQMYKANPDNASKYDRLVINKSKRLAKLVKQCISAGKMKADITLTKVYQQRKAGYNQYKTQFLPSQRLSIAKLYAKKYGTNDVEQYKALAEAALRAGLGGAYDTINNKIQAAQALQQIDQRATPEQRAAFQEFFKQNLRVARIQRNEAVPVNQSQLSNQFSDESQIQGIQEQIPLDISAIQRPQNNSAISNRSARSRNRSGIEAPRVARGRFAVNQSARSNLVPGRRSQGVSQFLLSRDSENINQSNAQ